MSERSPDTLPSAITCRGSLLKREDIDEGYIEYSDGITRIVCLDGIWGWATNEPPLLRAWRWVKEVCGG